MKKYRVFQKSLTLNLKIVLHTIDSFEGSLKHNTGKMGPYATNTQLFICGIQLQVNLSTPASILRGVKIVFVFTAICVYVYIIKHQQWCTQAKVDALHKEMNLFKIYRVNQMIRFNRNSQFIVLYFVYGL